MKVYAADVWARCRTPLENILTLEELERKHVGGRDGRGRYWHVGEDVRELSSLVATQVLHEEEQ